MPPAEPLFECVLTVPAIGGANGLPEQAFISHGRNKKIAEHYAAEKALDFLRSKGLIAPALTPMQEHQLPPDLQKQLSGTSTDSGVRLHSGTTRACTACKPTSKSASDFNAQLFHLCVLLFACSTVMPLPKLFCACSCSSYRRRRWPTSVIGPRWKVKSCLRTHHFHHHPAVRHLLTMRPLCLSCPCAWGSAACHAAMMLLHL